MADSRRMAGDTCGQLLALLLIVLGSTAKTEVVTRGVGSHGFPNQTSASNITDENSTSDNLVTKTKAPILPSSTSGGVFSALTGFGDPKIASGGFLSFTGGTVQDTQGLNISIPFQGAQGFSGGDVQNKPPAKTREANAKRHKVDANKKKGPARSTKSPVKVNATFDGVLNEYNLAPDPHLTGNKAKNKTKNTNKAKTALRNPPTVAQITGFQSFTSTKTPKSSK